MKFQESDCHVLGACLCHGSGVAALLAELLHYNRSPPFSRPCPGPSRSSTNCFCTFARLRYYATPIWHPIDSNPRQVCLHNYGLKWPLLAAFQGLIWFSLGAVPFSSYCPGCLSIPFPPTPQPSLLAWFARKLKSSMHIDWSPPHFRNCAKDFFPPRHTASMVTCSNEWHFPWFLFSLPTHYTAPFVTLPQYHFHLGGSALFFPVFLHAENAQCLLMTTKFSPFSPAHLFFHNVFIIRLCANYCKQSGSSTSIPRNFHSRPFPGSRWISDWDGERKN